MNEARHEGVWRDGNGVVHTDGVLDDLIDNPDFDRKITRETRLQVGRELNLSEDLLDELYGIDSR